MELGYTEKWSGAACAPGKIDDGGFCKCNLLESHARQVDLLLSLPHGIVIVDADAHHIIDVNPQAITMIGAARDRIVGRRCHAFICPNREGNCPITDAGKEMDRSETVLLTADGQSIPVLKSVIAADLNGQNVLIESFVDLTEQKRAEQLRVEKEKFKGVVEMAGAICHEFSQPLMALSGYADLLLMDVDEGRSEHEKILQLKKQVERMGALTKKLLEITSYEKRSYLDTEIIDIHKSASMAGTSP